jgi:hypothetical protein
MINSGERGFGLPTFSHAEKNRRWGAERLGRIPFELHELL